MKLFKELYKVEYLVVAVSGGALMIIEVASTRLLAPYFGSSVFIWTSAISVILAALTIGYFLGSKLSQDKHPELHLRKAFLGASIATIFVPFLVHAIGYVLPRLHLGQTTTASLYFFTLLAALVALMPPGIFYGMVSPLMIESLGRKGHHPGVIAGRVFAVSTIGSIVGTLVTPIIFFPLFGTYLTFLFVAFFVSILMLFYTDRKKRIAALFIIIILFIIGLLLRPNVLTENVVYAKESPYQVIRLVETPEKFNVIYDAGFGHQSVHNKETPWTGAYWDWLALLPELNEINSQNIALVGFAGGAIPRIWDETEAGKSVNHVDSVDIDGEVFNLVREQFSPDLYGTEPHMQDGRTFLQQTDHAYDLIILDAYTNELQIPPHLATYEFFELTRSKLTEDGMMGMNIALGENNKLGRSLINTIANVFPKVVILTHPDMYNVIVIGTNGKEVDFGKLRELAIQYPFSNSSDLQSTAVSPDDNQPVFTDDWAPVEVYSAGILF